MTLKALRLLPSLQSQRLNAIIFRQPAMVPVHAGMAELADAQASGACGSNIVRVQVPFPALYQGCPRGSLLCAIRRIVQDTLFLNSYDFKRVWDAFKEFTDKKDSGSFY